MDGKRSHVGELVRDWRHRRRLSQLALALDADVSQRHLSFVESGRAAPSRNLLLRISELMEVPLRERNIMLIAGGFAPVFPEQAIDAPGLSAVKRAIDLILRGHEPYPALAVDRHWTMVAANAAVAPLLGGIDPARLKPPLNVLELSMHPDGLAPQIVNFRQWRAHILERLRQQIDASADPVLISLLERLLALPVPSSARPEAVDGDGSLGGVAVPLLLRTDFGVLSFISTTTVFGTALNVTVSELAIESFFPADADTAEMMRRIVTAG